MSESPGTPYLEEFTEGAPGNGGRNSSTFSPDIEEGCRGEDVVEDAGPPEPVSFPAVAGARGFSGFWSTG